MNCPKGHLMFPLREFTPDQHGQSYVVFRCNDCNTEMKIDYQQYLAERRASGTCPFCGTKFWGQTMTACRNCDQNIPRVQRSMWDEWEEEFVKWKDYSWCGHFYTPEEWEEKERHDKLMSESSLAQAEAKPVEQKPTAYSTTLTFLVVIVIIAGFVFILINSLYLTPKQRAIEENKVIDSIVELSQDVDNEKYFSTLYTVLLELLSGVGVSITQNSNGLYVISFMSSHSNSKFVPVDDTYVNVRTKYINGRTWGWGERRSWLEVHRPWIQPCLGMIHKWNSTFLMSLTLTLVNSSERMARMERIDYDGKVVDDRGNMAEYCARLWLPNVTDTFAEFGEAKEYVSSNMTVIHDSASGKVLYEVPSFPKQE